MRELGPTDLKRLHRGWRRRTTGRLALILDDVQGPFNLGAILRTGAAYRVDPLWLTAGACDPDHRRVGVTAMGSERFVTVRRTTDGATAVGEARDEGFTVVALELAEDAIPLFDVDLTGDVALVVGHEDRGVARTTREAADVVAFLPQLGRIGSLNVATAAAVGCYEWARQHWQRPG